MKFKLNNRGWGLSDFLLIGSVIMICLLFASVMIIRLTNGLKENLKANEENRKTEQKIEVENSIEEESNTNNYNSETINKKKDFLNSIKIEENSEILYLKIKLENGEVKAIDLTDEQIDKLQEIYDKEIIEKQNKINKLKAVS